jgi:sporulation protein YlmC with PRC-barrel domain
MASGRVVDAGLHLLDRQIIDCNGRLAGKVDDLELTPSRDPGSAPVVTAILVGPGALSRRLGGRLGAWVESVHARLHPSSEPGPAVVPFGLVKRVDNAVHLSVDKSELEVGRFEDWARRLVIAKIPGAGHAPE